MVRRGLDQKQPNGNGYLGGQSADIKGSAGRTAVLAGVRAGPQACYGAGAQPHLVPLILLYRIRLLPRFR
jgi:hypothetical protein